MVLDLGDESWGVCLSESTRACRKHAEEHPLQGLKEQVVFQRWFEKKGLFANQKRFC